MVAEVGLKKYVNPYKVNKNKQYASESFSREVYEL